MEWLAQYPLAINAMTHGAILIEFSGVLALVQTYRGGRSWEESCSTWASVPSLNVPGFGEVMIKDSTRPFWLLLRLLLLP